MQIAMYNFHLIAGYVFKIVPEHNILALTFKWIGKCCILLPKWEHEQTEEKNLDLHEIHLIGM